MGFLDRFLKKPAEIVPKKAVSPIQPPKAVGPSSNALAKVKNAEAMRVDIAFDSYARTATRRTCKKCEAPPITAFTEVKVAYGFRAFVKHRTDGIDESIVYYSPHLWTKRGKDLEQVKELQVQPYAIYRLDDIEQVDELLDHFATLVPGLARFPKEERKITRYAV